MTLNLVSTNSGGYLIPVHAQLVGRHARREAFLKRQPIRVIAEDRAPLVATAGDVVDRKRLKI